MICEIKKKVNILHKLLSAIWHILLNFVQTISVKQIIGNHNQETLLKVRTCRCRKQPLFELIMSQRASLIKFLTRKECQPTVNTSTLALILLYELGASSSGDQDSLNEFLTLVEKFGSSLLEHNLFNTQYNDLVSKLRSCNDQEVKDVYDKNCEDKRQFEFKLLTHCLIDGIMKIDSLVTDDENNAGIFQKCYIFDKEHGVIVNPKYEDERRSNINLAASSESNINETMNKLIEIYTTLIEKYPSIQFITSELRTLPHLYCLEISSIGYENLNLHPLLVKQKASAADNKNVNYDSNKDMAFSPAFEKIIDQIYDRYNGFAKVIDNFKSAVVHDQDTNSYSNDDDEDDEDDDYDLKFGKNVMSVSDLAQYVQSCIYSFNTTVSVSVCRRICDEFEPESNGNYITKNGFKRFYKKAAINRCHHVAMDIKKQGLLGMLVNYNSDYDHNYNVSGNVSLSTSANEMIQKRKDFVKLLKKKFIQRERMLIDNIIKQSQMKQRFDTLNDDIKQLIFKHVHPLRLNHEDSPKYHFQSEICNFYKFQNMDELKKQQLLQNRFFYDLLFQKISNIGEYDENEIRSKMRQWKNNGFFLDEFCMLLSDLGVLQVFVHTSKFF